MSAAVERRGARRRGCGRRPGVAAAGRTHAATLPRRRESAATPDGDARRALDAPMLRRPPARHARRRLDLRRRGRRRGPPIVLSHGVTLSVRTWFHQLESLPEGRVPHDRVRPPRPRRSRCSATRATRSRTSPKTSKTVVLGLDLRDAVLVGHSMGGVAVQAFVTPVPGDRGRAGRGHRAAVDARVHAVRVALDATKTRLEKHHQARARHELVVGAPNLGSSLARLGFGTDPHPSHVELVRRMMLGVPARDAPRRAARARRPRPHRAISRTCGSRRW